ncbi:MAG: glycosyltransferase family 2 protein [Pseudomonadales bacterium]|nr:glycosyltransferase family 2 protein [Pseudomonadales bacterium]
MQQPLLSVVINTKNSEAFLDKALKSVTFADEIVVVDMHSTDTTQKIAKSATNHFYTFDDVGYVEPARNFAISKASGNWILILDADEEVPERLQQRILQLVADPSADAYFIPRSNEVFGKELRKTGWWPDHQLRLFKAGTVTWDDQIHSVPKVTGKVEYLPSDESVAILHHNYQHISQFVERMNNYTSIEANNVGEASTTPTEVFGAFKDEFFRRLFKNEGLSEGMHGVSLSFLQSFYQILVVLKIWEKQGFKEEALTERATLSALREFDKELRYWMLTYKIRKSSGLIRLFARMRRKFGL